MYYYYYEPERTEAVYPYTYRILLLSRTANPYPYRVPERTANYVTMVAAGSGNGA